MDAENSLVIFAVIYNSYPETFRFIDSIRVCFGDSAKLVLVDNSEGNPDPVFTAMVESYHFITYLKAGKNLGYFHGAQFGLDHYLENYQVYPQWIIVCNVDIIFETPGFLEKLGPYQSTPDLGLIAPAIISSQWKTDLNPFLFSRMSLKKLNFLKVIYSNAKLHNGYVVLHYIKKIFSSILYRMPVPGRGQTGPARNIYAPHGSCIIFNKKYFERGGTLLHISFLFGEEIFVGETASQLGLKILYVPGLHVSHFEHSSIGSFISRKINRFYSESLTDIINNYYPSNRG